MTLEKLKNMDKELDFINKRGLTALDKNLLPEVVWSALNAMKEDSSISVEKAFEIGCKEWDA